ncbi:hypothetical protein [Gloeobacter kilaueensis]|uniref:Uncharacterized protein n=1 Tax=Gloeobacter kilaueensis (strain ATCC BAA-2537 / CCAP 1431/1 / ULC 316 / JS1) TaxID=1183438 RepID=U5QF10_GLOK1|nr:hypothetical protein [Gloeobacter kilaueensis]AGY57443.1 hypothetical protein GKIL_1197 [Gloeobacter kilaueensis JS1]
MSKHQPAPPCIVDVGLVVNKQDMIRVLEDLGRVSYMDIQDGQVRRCGEAYIMEVFSDPAGATMIANRTIYLNVNSFDCLRLDWPSDERPQFNLIQEGRIVRLIPATDPLEERDSEEPTHTIRHRLNTGLRSVVEEVLLESSRLSEDWDDDDDDLDG